MIVYQFLYTNDYDPKCITFSFPNSATLEGKKKVVNDYFEYHWDMDLSEIPAYYDIGQYMSEVYRLWGEVTELYHTEMYCIELGDKAEAH